MFQIDIEFFELPRTKLAETCLVNQTVMFQNVPSKIVTEKSEPIILEMYSQIQDQNFFLSWYISGINMWKICWLPQSQLRDVSNLF